jgi:hypothetical protein
VVVAFLLSAITGIIYFKRRQRLQMQQARQTTIDPERPLPDPATETEFKEITLPLTSSPSVPKPPTVQPRTQGQMNSEQPPRSTGLRADAEERNKLVEMMQYIQQRLLLLEGESVQDGGVHKKMEYSGRPEPAT